MFNLHAQLAKDCAFVCDLDLCQVLMLNDSQYPWLILVPRVADIKEIIDLSPSQQQVLWQESAQVSAVLQSLFKGDKLNVAALGNMVPQLHIHHIVRYTNDASWPKPVWGQVPAIPYEADALAERLNKIRSCLL
jgi:diadenosine tetraphosphate (Ap4A) HIT family hydrolase